MSKQITGSKGNDLLLGTRKDDRIEGGAGDDWILAGRGNDRADGDAGSDRLFLGSGNDLAIYNMSENRGAHDVYDGGAGKDTLQLEFTRAQWLTNAVQNDIDRFLDTLNGCGGYGGRDFNFTAFDLKARNFEALKIIVDGVELSAKDDAVDARNDVATVAANQAVTVNVLGNDKVPDLVKKVEQVSGPKAGALTVNADGTFTFDTKGAFDSLAAGKTATVTFTYRVTDADGDSDTATVTITVTGVGGAANQQPVVVGAIATGSATEIVDHGAGENTATHSATGTVSFTDANLGDSHTVSVTANGNDYRGTLTASISNVATGDGAGVVTWNFSVGDSSLDSLAAGQTLTQSYVVTINDGHGGTATQTVTITVVGSNDAPTITSVVQAGSVTETVDGTAGENVTAHLASGAVTFADVDLTDTHSASFQAQGGGYLGTFALDPVNQAGDSVGWRFSLADAAIDGLAAGQTLTQNYVVAVDDGHGSMATQTVTVTIVGSNDAPTISSAVQEGSVTEIADGTPGENATTLAASGAVTFADVDIIDTHGASFTAQGGDYFGAFSLDPVDQAGDSVGWHFSVADSVLDGLAVGQTLTQSYVVTVNDGHGGTAAQTVTVTIHGANDQPVITSVAQAGSITELADQAAGEGSTTLSTTGAITFADVDLNDMHVATFVPGVGPYLGTFALGAVDQAGHAVGWTFSASDFALDSLAAGQSLTQSYVVTVDDGHGATAVQTVTVTINGANDAPTITSATTNGAVFEIADGAAGENATTHVTSGAINFADVDIIDAHSASFVAQGSGYLGAFSLAVDQAGDSVGWTFSVADGVLDGLADGQTLTQGYDVTIDDGHGGMVAQTVTITLQGSNDAPTITSAVQAGSVTEIVDGAAGENQATLTATGAVTFADIDAIDTHVASIVAQGGGYLGTFALDQVDQAGGSVGWSFSVADSLLDSLAVDETLTQSYLVTVDDGHGAAVSQTVTITIHGSNDAPTITSAVQAAVVTEIADGGSGENATTLLASGAVTFADVDLNDTTHSASFQAQASDYLGTFALDPLGQAGDLIGWHFSVADADLDSLRADQTLTQRYLVNIDDGHGGSVTETVTVEIQGTNDAPVAVADAATGGQSEVLTVDVLANDTDVDLGDSRTLFGASVPSGKGSVSVVDDKLVFDPGMDFRHLAQGASEVVTASYIMFDAAGAQAASTVEIAVVGANDAPIAVSDFASGGRNEILTIDVLANDIDVDDGHTLTLVSGGVPEFSGQVSMVNNQLVFDPGDDFADLGPSGQRDVLLTYTMQDEHGAISSSTVTLTITEGNSTPVVDDVFVMGSEDGAIPVPFTSAFDNDVGDTLTYSFVPDGIHHGTLISNGGGSYTYTPDANFSGEDNFIYTATDSHGAVGSGTLFFTVNAVADTPTLSVADGAVSGNAGSPIALDIAAGLTDTDGSEILQLEVTGVPAGWLLSSGVLDSNSGTWLVPGNSIADLSVTAPSGVEGDATLLVTAVATEQSNGNAAQSETQSVSVTVASDDMFAANLAAGFSLPETDTPTDFNAAIVPYEDTTFDGLLNDPPHTMDFIL